MSEPKQPHSISEKQLAANRANAAHSTGPRTAQGKAASSRNATSHGLCSATVTVFAWESKPEFDRMREDYMRRFRPIDRVEADLVDCLVDARWRRNRVVSIETCLLDMGIDETFTQVQEDYPKDREEGVLRVAISFMRRHGDGVWDALTRHLAAAERSFQRALRDLKMLQGDRFKDTPEPAELPAENAESAENAHDSDVFPIRSHFRMPRRPQPAIRTLEIAEMPVLNAESNQEIVRDERKQQPDSDLAA